MAFSAVTERGSFTEKVVGTTTVAVSPSAALTVGKIVFVLAITDCTTLVDGASTDHSALVDTDGHTWNKVYERTSSSGVSLDGPTHSLWWTKVTSEIGVADVITLTTTATTAKLLMVWEATVGAGNTVAVATGGTAFQETVTNTAVSVTLAGLPSKEYLLLGISSREGEIVTWTEDADYTNVFAAEGITTGVGGAAISNVTGNVGYRIATLTGDTFAATAPENLDNANALIAFEEVVVNQTLTGVLFQKAPTFFQGVLTGGAIAVAPSGGNRMGGSGAIRKPPRNVGR